MTSNIKSGLNQHQPVGSSKKLKLQTKMISNGGQPEILKGEYISKALVLSSPHFKLEHNTTNQTLHMFQLKTTSNGR